MERASKALFLDRDGVVNEEKGYVHRIEDFVFIDGVFETCRLFREWVYKLFIVTNQAGIGRGFYSETEFRTLTIWMCDRFRENDIVIDGVYYCPHHQPREWGNTAGCVNAGSRSQEFFCVLRENTILTWPNQSWWVMGRKILLRPSAPVWA